MTNQRKNIFTAIFLLFIIGAVLSYVYSDLKKSTSTSATFEQKDIEAGPITLGDGSTGDYKITVVPSEETKTSVASAKIPDLNRPVTNNNRLDEAAFNTVSQKIEEITKKLKDDPKDELNWLNLGIYRKMLGDFEGAVSILNFVAVSWPSDYTPYNNLADLYQYYIKEYSLAEKNWLKVIELKPDYAQAYENLYGLYVSQYTEKQREALPILLKGVKNNPKSVELLIYVARHYRSSKDVANANIFYEKAMWQAKLDGNQQIVESIKLEASEVK